MNTFFRIYRLPVALVTGFLVVALLVAGAAARDATHAPVGSADILQSNAGSSNPHNTGNWAGNAVTGPRGTYKAVSVEFRIPRIAFTNPNQVAFWAGLGGDAIDYPNDSLELVQAGIFSYIDSSGGQYNFAFFAYYDQNDSGKTVRVHFDSGLHAGDKINVSVESNLNNDGKTYITISNLSTGESKTPDTSGVPFSDSHTGECIAERPGLVGSQLPLAVLNPPPSATPYTVWFNDCVVTNARGTESHPVGPGNGWANTNWWHIVNNSGALLLGIGAVDSSGSFPVIWHQTQ
jgi:Peptidase A4 family